jgi:Ion channel
LHVLTILPWACFYRWNCFATWESALYFSAASYSTVGASDLVLPQAWRTLCPIESIVGVLLRGLSAGFLFAIVTSLIGRDIEAEREEVHADSTSSLGLAEQLPRRNGLGSSESGPESALVKSEPIPNRAVRLMQAGNVTRGINHRHQE